MKHKRGWLWGPGSVVILALLVLWMKPAHAYYICPQPDGTQLITDTPGPDCVKQEEPDVPGLPSGEKPEELLEKRNPPNSEETPGEQLDYHGHNKEWWQSRLRGLKQEKNELLIQILDAKRRLDLIPTDLLGIINSRQRRKINNEINTLNEMLQIVDQGIKKDLPEEARKAGAQPGWVR